MTKRPAIRPEKTALSRVCLAWVMVLIVGTFLVPLAHGAPDFYVTDNGSGTGSGWGDPSSLANALSSSAASDVIWMKEGTYTNASTFSISTDGLEIYGGFDGTETLLSQRDWTNQVVLLDGEDTRCVLNIQADNLLLDGLVITNGRETVTHAAGVRVSGYTNLTMRNCTVVENTLVYNGGYGAGAYFNNAGTVLLSNCVFRANLATSRGYGVGFLTQGTTTLTLRDCEIRENHDSGGDQRTGKGFYLKSGTLAMVGTTVADNYFDSDDNDGRGGGGYIENGTASFTNCAFTGNDVKHSDGGGLYIANGNVTIENCTFADNGGYTDDNRSEGGAIYQNSGTVTIKNSIFWDNQTGNDANDGDTIYQAAGTLNISYCCFDGTELPRMRFVNGTWGDGIITNNPLFATDYTDVHLKSEVGRWNGSSWVTDTTNSPCIDAGDPGSGYSNEPTGENGAWINMGAYGNTWQASKSTNEAPTVEAVEEVVIANAAELRGQLTAGSVSAITFYYGTTDQGEAFSGWDGTNVLSDAQGLGEVFTSVAGGLQESQSYVFRIYATNDFGYDWSDTNWFTTGTAAPGGGSGVIHVDADAVGVEDGRSWTNAFTTFEDALAAADAGQATSIWVADGSYQDVATYIIQTNGLSVYGGFDGAETLLSERDWTNNVALLDGQAMRRVLSVAADDVVLDGLVMTNGYDADLGGAGLRISGNTGLTLLNCRLTGNLQRGNDKRGAGAYFLNAGDVLVSNCVFRGNFSNERTRGLGFYSQGTDLTVLDSEIRENVHVSGDYRYGAGFNLDGGTLIMRNTIIADNDTKSNDSNAHGGGGYMGSGSASFTNCVFTGNKCGRSDGGALYLNSGNVTIENCTFANNSGYTGNDNSEGGAIYQNAGTVTIKNSIFWGNDAGNDGNDGDTIFQTSGDTMNISYSCLEGTNTPHLIAGGTLNWGSGVITNDPLFATNDYTDVHLKSTAGRWSGSNWVNDAVMSPCIDAGDPTSDHSNELDGDAINMGAYGNTAEASLTYGGGGSVFMFR